jgi:small subunit ribosomal protein S1
MMNDLTDNETDNGDDTPSNPGRAEFAQLLEASFKKTRKSLSVGDRIQSEILSISRDEIYVSTGMMQDGLVAKKDFLSPEGVLQCRVGDRVELYVTQVRGSNIFLSPHPTAINLAETLEDAFDLMLPIEGRVSELCKGGVRVSILGKTAFCPISQLDLVRVETGEEYIGKKFEFLITQFSEGGRNIIVSRKKLLQEKRGLQETAFLEEKRPGDRVHGVISRIEPFGAFVSLGDGVEGLIHISELSWSRVAAPHEVVSIGQTVTVKFLGHLEKEGQLRISLSLKQAEPEPWSSLPAGIQVGAIVDGKVTRCMKFGAFVEIAKGIEGLVSLGEMSETKRVLRAEDVVKVGQAVRVLIQKIQPEERRIQLSLNVLQEQANEEWKSFAQKPAQSFGTFGDHFKNVAIKKKQNR